MNQLPGNMFRTQAYEILCGILVSVLLLISNNSNAQALVNGSFETNTALADQVNLTNAVFNTMVPNSVAFGTYGDMDLVASATYCGGPPNGNWYVALTGAGTDAFSMKLNTPLVAGSQYKLTFSDHGCGAPYSIGPCPVQVGVSTTSNTFGTLVYTAPLPVSGLWTSRMVIFTAPVSGQYITVQLSGGGLSNWTQVDNFILSPGTLPIELISFTANYVNDQTDLVWQTATETNNSYFEIERSLDAINFESIDHISGNGTTTVAHEYSIADKNVPEGIVYYQLKQVDFDGRFSKSEIVAVNNTNKKTLSFALLGSSADNLQLAINGLRESELAHIYIRSMNGQIIFTKNISGNTLAELSIPNLAGGLYSIELTSTDKSVRKLISLIH